MKGFFRSFLIIIFAFWLVLKVIPGVTLAGDWQTFILVSAAIFIGTFFVKPVIKLIFLPFNMITVNLISVLLTTGLLFLLTLIIPQLKVTTFTFEGVNYNGLMIPRMDVNQLLTLFVAAIIITVIAAALNWIAD